MNAEILSERIVSCIVSENPLFFAGIAFVLLMTLLLAIADLPFVFFRWIDLRHAHFNCALRHQYGYDDPCHYRCGLHANCDYYKKRPSLSERFRIKKTRHH